MKLFRVNDQNRYQGNIGKQIQLYRRNRNGILVKLRILEISKFQNVQPRFTKFGKSHSTRHISKHIVNRRPTERRRITAFRKGRRKGLRRRERKKVGGIGQRSHPKIDNFELKDFCHCLKWPGS